MGGRLRRARYQAGTAELAAEQDAPLRGRSAPLILVGAAAEGLRLAGSFLETLNIGLVWLFEQFWHGDNAGAW
jgi:hypothetical protein